MRSPLQRALAESLAKILRPVIRLMLSHGIGCSEFIEIGKSEYVRIATEEFGVRRRPTNVSRIAAMTGLSRKEIRRIGRGRTASNQVAATAVTPIEAVIYNWHFDPFFCERPGEARVLSLNGESSFSTLIARYAGDIPVGAMKKELSRIGAIEEIGSDRVRATKPYIWTKLDKGLLANVAASITSVANTMAHNPDLIAVSEHRDGQADSAPRDSASHAF